MGKLLEVGQKLVSSRLSYEFNRNFYTVIRVTKTKAVAKSFCGTITVEIKRDSGYSESWQIYGKNSQWPSETFFEWSKKRSVMVGNSIKRIEYKKRILKNITPNTLKGFRMSTLKEICDIIEEREPK